MKTANRVRIFRRASLLPLLAVPILFFATGCASGGLRGGGAPSLSRHKGLTAHLENRNWSDMNVYLVIDGRRTWRLATLRPLEKTAVKIQPRLLQGRPYFHLEATALGSGETVTTPEINAGPGDQIVWTMEHYLPSSINSMWIR